MAILNASGIIGRIFIHPLQEDGKSFWVYIVKIIDDHKIILAQDSGQIQFVCSFNDDKYKEIMSYKKIINHIKNKEEEYIVCKFRWIITHEITLIVYRPHYKGYWYNVIFELETGETTTEPIYIIAADEPITYSFYAGDNNLLLAVIPTLMLSYIL